MHIEVSGTEGAAPLILLNGIPSGPDWAAPLVQRAQTTHHVFVPHLPGYGRTPPLRPYSWSAVMTQLEDALASRVRTPAAVVAFSGGVWRALELAVRGRLPIRGVLGIGGVAHLNDVERAGFRAFAAGLRGGFDGTTIAAERFLASRRDDAAVDTVKAFVRAITAEALADELEAMASEPDLLPRLSSLPCPVVLRTGTHDVSCPPEKAEAIAAAVPNGRVELIEGGGHALWLESPLDVFALPDIEAR